MDDLEVSWVIDEDRVVVVVDESCKSDEERVWLELMGMDVEDDSSLNKD